MLSPADKARVERERAVQYVRIESGPASRSPAWNKPRKLATLRCARTAGMRLYGSTAARPLQVHNDGVMKSQRLLGE